MPAKRIAAMGRFYRYPQADRRNCAASRTGRSRLRCSHIDRQLLTPPLRLNTAATNRGASCTSSLRRPGAS
jgi:hypothetical protein